MDSIRPLPVATHHVDCSEESINRALVRLHHRDVEPYHATRVFKVTLLGQDDGVEELTEWLQEGSRRVGIDRWVQKAIAEDRGEGGSTAAPPRKFKPPIKSRLPIRIFSMSNHKLTEKGYQAIGRFAKLHGSLTNLDLPLNNSGIPLPPLRGFSENISQSLLRKLCLSSTPMTIDGFCHLLDHLDAPCLQELRLSLTLSSEDQISFEESRRAASSVARMLRPAPSSQDTMTGTSILRTGKAPALEVLTLNGNTLTLRGVKMIVAAVVGGPSSPANQTLTHVELFATLNTNEEDTDEEEEVGAEPSHSPTRPSMQRVLSIGSSFYEARRSRRRSQAQGEAMADVAAAGDLHRSKQPSVSGYYVNGNSQFADASASRRPRYHYFPPDDRRSYRHVTSSNWRRDLGRRLWTNVQRRSTVISVAQDLIGKGRIIGCRSRPGPSTDSPLCLSRLPAELRLHCLRCLDSDRVLSPSQFNRVISWACEPQTIGYGQVNIPPPWSEIEDEEPPRPSSTSSSLLPHEPWSWKEMLRRSFPRDWTSESWDLWNEQRDTIPIIGGGGGPDGQGGVTDRTSSGVSVSVDVGDSNESSSTKRGHGRGRATSDQSSAGLFSRAPEPALMAFLEATGTKTPDSFWWID